MIAPLACCTADLVVMWRHPSQLMFHQPADDNAQHQKSIAKSVHGDEVAYRYSRGYSKSVCSLTVLCQTGLGLTAGSEGAEGLGPLGQKATSKLIGGIPNVVRVHTFRFQISYK